MTSNTLPSPLTPPDCDLRDFPFLPLDVARLRDSDLATTRSPEECWAAVLLWCASWHQVPAASLPDDDRVLSNLAGYGRVVKEWQRVKEGAMHGWVLCSDGRWYHPVVAAKANNALEEKRLHHYGKFKDRMRKAHGKDAVIPSFADWISAGMPAEWPQNSGGIPAEEVERSGGNKKNSAGIPAENALKGEGEGEGEGNINPRTANAVQRERAHGDPPTDQVPSSQTTHERQKPRPPSLTASAMQAALPGLSEAVATDYLAFRRSLKAPLTPSAWASIAAEVQASGCPPDAAIAEAMAAGWRGFKAEWLRNRAASSATARPTSRASPPPPDPDASARFAARIQGQAIGRIIEGETA